MKYLVTKPFEAGNRHLKSGDLIDASEFRNLKLLIEQRYLTLHEGETPVKPVPVPSPSPTPAPTAKRRGRPRKVTAAEQPSE